MPIPLRVQAVVVLALGAAAPVLAQSGRGAQHPIDVARAAALAVEHDSARTLRDVWKARLAGNGSDRVARFALATLARLTYDYDTADREYRALRDARLADGIAVLAHVDYANSLLVRNDLPRALAQAESGAVIARRLGDGRLLAAAYVELGMLRALTVSVPSGIAAADSAAMAATGKDLMLLALAESRRADLLAVTGDTGARRAAAAAIDLARATRDARTLATAYRAAGKGHELRGVADSALAYYDSAVVQLRHARDHASLAVVHTRYANVHVSRGEYGLARRRLDEARRNAELSREGVALASSSMGLGAMALNLRDLPAAHAHLTRALEAFREQGDPQSVLLSRYYLAMVTHARGEHATARADLADIATRMHALGDIESYVQAQRAIITVAMHEGEYAAARQALAAARRVAATRAMDTWLTELAGDEGRLALRTGDLRRAERLLAAYAASADSTAHLARYDARIRLAEALARQGRLDAAEREMTAATDAIDAYRAALGERELRTHAFQATALERDDPSHSAAWVIAALAAGGRVESAFELAEARRARELADAMGRARGLGSGVTAVDHPTRRIGPERLGVVARRIPRSTALLHFTTGPAGAPTTAFVVTRAGITAHRLPPVDSLAAQVRNFVGLLEGSDYPRALGRRLGAALLGAPLAALPAEVQQLVVVPDGLLHRVPFDALLMDDGRHVVERFATSISPSASIAARMWAEPPRPPRPVRLLAFADPSLPGAAGLPALPASRREVRRASRYVDESDIRIGALATASYLRRAPLEQYDVLHFATHAVVDDRREGRTSLSLASTADDEGSLSPGDLASLRLDADLVVLSACRTAGGVIVGGEGVHGLTSALLEAGARSVVASGWRISDQRVVRLIDDFYAALADGRPVAAALQQAKLAAIARGAPPGEWAALAVTGNPMITVPLERPMSFGSFSALIAGLVALLVGGALYGARTVSRRAAERASVPSLT